MRQIQLLTHIDPSQWKPRLVQLRAFKARFSHCHIPPSWSGNPSLAKWASAVRTHPEHLSDDQIRALLEMGFNFIREDRGWLMHYFELLDLTRKFGVCPQRLQDATHHHLDTWMHNLRARKKLQPRWRIKRLTQLGFEWTMIDFVWRQHFAELKRFQAQHGHCIVSIADPEHRRLAKWVYKQRVRMKTGKLSLNCRQQLKEIGFGSFPGRFALRLPELEAFWRQHGHLNIPRKTHRSLNDFCRQVRFHPLTPQQRQRLDRMGFPWSPLQVAWDRRFDDLTAYQRKHKTCRVPWTRASRSLADWVSRQRGGKGKLSKEQRRRLDSIGFAW